MLEGCGRWLYKNPETTERCAGNLDKMMKFKVGKFLDENLKNIVDNAYFECIPQERVIVPREVRPLLHEYIRKLLYVDLNSKTIDSVTTRLLRLSWDDECVEFIRISIFEIYNVDYANISCVAQVVSRLNQQYNIGMMIVDDVIEEIRYAMEFNNFLDSQLRLSYARFFAELHNVGVVDISVCFLLIVQF